MVVCLLKGKLLNTSINIESTQRVSCPRIITPKWQIEFIIKCLYYGLLTGSIECAGFAVVGPQLKFLGNAALE